MSASAPSPKRLTLKVRVLRLLLPASAATAASALLLINSPLALTGLAAGCAQVLVIALVLALRTRSAKESKPAHDPEERARIRSLRRYQATLFVCFIVMLLLIYKGWLARTLLFSFKEQAEQRVKQAVDEVLSLPERLQPVLEPTAEQVLSCLFSQEPETFSCAGVQRCLLKISTPQLAIGPGRLVVPIKAAGLLDAQGNLLAWSGDLSLDVGPNDLRENSRFTVATPENEVVYRVLAGPHIAGGQRYFLVLEVLIDRFGKSAAETLGDRLENALEFWYPGIHAQVSAILRMGVEQLPVAVDIAGIPAETEAVVPLVAKKLFLSVQINALPLDGFLARNTSVIELIVRVLLILIWSALIWQAVLMLQSAAQTVTPILQQLLLLSCAGAGAAGWRWLIMALWPSLPWLDNPPAILDPAFFGTTRDLLSDPLSCLLTCLFIAVIVGLVVQHFVWSVRVGALRGNGSAAAPRSNFATIGLAAAMSMAWLVGFEFFIDTLAHNSSHSWWWLHLEHLDGPGLCMQASLVLLGVVSVALLLQFSFIVAHSRRSWWPWLCLMIVAPAPSAARFLLKGETPTAHPWISFYETGLIVLIVLTGERWFRHRSPRTIRRLFLLVIFAAVVTAVSYPAVHHRAWMNLLDMTEIQTEAAAKQQESFPQTLSSEVLTFVVQHRQALAAEETPFESAYALWQQTELASLRFPSNLSLWDRDGNLVSRFSFGLSSQLTLPLEQRLARRRDAMPHQDQIVYLGRNLQIYVMGATIAKPEEGFVTLAIPQYPRLLLQSTFFSPIISPLEYDQMGDVIVTEYDGEQPVSSFGGDPTPYSSPVVRNASKWRVKTSLGQRGLYAVLFHAGASPQNGQGKTVSVALPRPSLLKHLKSCIELYLISVPLIGALWYLYGLMTLLSFEHPAKPRYPARAGMLPFRWRFIFAFLIVGILPLAMLSVSFDALTKDSIAGLLESQAKESGANLTSLVKSETHRMTEDDLEPQRSHAATVSEPPASLEWATGFNSYAKPSAPEHYELFMTDPQSGKAMLIRQKLADALGNATPAEFLVRLQDSFGGNAGMFIDNAIAASTRPDFYLLGYLRSRLPGWVFDSLSQGRNFVWNLVEIAGIQMRITYIPLRAADGTITAVFSLIHPLALDPSGLPLPGREGLFLILAFGTVILLLLLSYWFSEMISQPIEALMQATSRIAQGNRNELIAERLPGEFNYLADALNRMATQIKQQQGNLEERRTFIETLLVNLSSGVISWNRSGEVTYLNTAARNVLGITEELHPAMTLQELLAPIGRGALYDLIAQFRAAGSRTTENQLGMVIGERVVTIRFFLTKLAVIDNESGDELLVFDDLSDLIRSSKLAAWTDMARQVAHEIKNPLTPIQLSIEHLRQLRQENSAAFDSNFDRLTDLILEQVEGLRTIASEFSRHAKLPSPRPVETELKSLIEETIELVRQSLPPNITIRSSHDPRLTVVRLDRDLVQRALLNILQNAVHAMPAGGLITVTASMEADRHRFSISIADTGTGIPEEQMVNLFEPYFSTQKEGSGIGLSIAKKTITEHGGEITVTSAQGRGSTFAIVLPLV